MEDLRKQIYRRYNDMMGRCYRPKNKEYHRYGGRGIFVCDNWKLNFENFYQWALLNGFNKTLSLDRIDTNGNYKPSNCRWVSMKIQANNTRRNRILEYNNVKYTMQEAADKFGISSRILQGRLNIGWSVKEAIERPYTGNISGRKPRIKESDLKDVYSLIREGICNEFIAINYNITQARVRQIKRKLLALNK